MRLTACILRTKSDGTSLTRVILMCGCLEDMDPAGRRSASLALVCELDFRALWHVAFGAEGLRFLAFGMIFGACSTWSA